MKIIARSILAATVFALAAQAQAFETWLDANTISKHVDAKEDFNQRNWGTGLELQSDSDQFIGMFGFYRNSVRVTTHYALLGWTPIEVLGVRAGLLFGAADGYPGLNNGNFGPIAAGVIRYEWERVGFNVIVLPPIHKTTNESSPLTFGLQLKFRF